MVLTSKPVVVYGGIANAQICLVALMDGVRTRLISMSHAYCQQVHVVKLTHIIGDIVWFGCQSREQAQVS